MSDLQRQHSEWALAYAQNTAVVYEQRDAAQARVRELEAENERLKSCERGMWAQTVEVRRLREVLRRIRDDDVPGTGDWSECVQDYARAALPDGS